MRRVYPRPRHQTNRRSTCPNCPRGRPRHIEIRLSQPMTPMGAGSRVTPPPPPSALNATRPEGDMKLKTTSKIAVFAAALAAFGYHNLPESSSTEPTDMGDLGGKLNNLDIQPENTDVNYDRDDWPHWSSTGNGCNTRSEARRVGKE